MSRKCPACDENIGFVAFAKHAMPGLIICPRCGTLISGPLLRQQWFVLASFGFMALVSLAWFITLLLHANIFSQLSILIVGNALSVLLSLWLLYKRTPLTTEPKDIVSVDEANLIIDPRYSVSTGVKLSPNMLSASDGPVSVPLSEIQNIRLNKGYFVVYCEPAGHPIEVFYPPILQSRILTTIRENGLGPKLVQDSQLND